MHVNFKIDGVTIFNSASKAILKGDRDLGTGLWRINLRSDKPQTQIAEANNFYELSNAGELVNYLHKAMFNTTKSALLQPFKYGPLTTWSGLTEDAISKHLKMTPAKAMGHINQKRQKFAQPKMISSLTWNII
jgi:hypothetical protein